MSDETTELQSLSKLKIAGRLRYWRGTIEIPETELHAICDEIQAEYDKAVAAMNKAAGNWVHFDKLLRGLLEECESCPDTHCTQYIEKVVKPNMRTSAATLGSQIDADLRKAIDFMRIWIAEDAHLGESEFSYEFEKAEGLRKLEAIEQAIAATLGSGMLTAEQVREAIERNSKSSAPRHLLSDDAYKAIADELNAELGSGTQDSCKSRIRKGLSYKDIPPHEPSEATKRFIEELDAELGSGTCRNISELNKNGVSGYYFTCSECGLSVCANMGVAEIEMSGPRSFSWKTNGRYEFEKCPRCGKAVER